MEEANNLPIAEFIQAAAACENRELISFFYELDGPRIYITEELIDYFVYCYLDFHKKKIYFGKLLRKTFTKNSDFWILDNRSYEVYYHFNGDAKWPHPDEFIGKRKTKHIIMRSACFKQLLLSASTEKSRRAIRAIIHLEELLRVYWKHQALKMPIQLAELENVRQFKIRELEARVAAKKRIGCIYFIQDGEFTKIGWTYHLRKRFAEIQSCNPRPLTIKSYYFAAFPELEEERLHLENQTYKVRGKWFKLKISGS